MGPQKRKVRSAFHISCKMGSASVPGSHRKKKEMCDPIFTFSETWAQHLFQVHTAKKKKCAIQFSHFLKAGLSISSRFTPQKKRNVRSNFHIFPKLGSASVPGSHRKKKKEMCDPIFTFSPSWAQHLFQVHTAKKKMCGPLFHIFCKLGA